MLLSRYPWYFCCLFVALSCCGQSSQAVDEIDVYHLGGSTGASFGNSAIDTEIVFKLLFDEALEDVGAYSDVKVYTDTISLSEDLRLKKIDAVYVSTLEFFELEDLINPDSLLAPVSNGKLHQQYSLYVNKTSNITSLSQLQNKKLAYTESDTLGQLFLDVELLKQNQDVSAVFFNDNVLYDNSNAAIVSVFFKQSNAVLAKQSDFEIAGELNPQVTKTLIPLLTSEELMMSIAASNKHMSSERLEKFRNFALVMHEKPRGKHLLNTFRSDKMGNVTLDDLVTVKELMKQKQRLLSQ